MNGTTQRRGFAYNLLGEMVEANLPEYAGKVLRCTYDNRGNLTLKTVSDQAGPTPDEYRETLGYDPTFRTF